MINRRREVRACVPHIAHLFAGGESIGYCLVEDLSIAGMRVATNLELRRGRRVNLVAQLPGSRALALGAKVVRKERRPSGENALALAFVDLTPDDVQGIRDAVMKHLADASLALVFFDTGEDGRPKRLVMGEDGKLGAGDAMVLPIAVAG